MAFKKENSEKKLDSAKYFEYRGSFPGTNQFEYVDDWGEKYVGLVSLSLNVLDTSTGEIVTVDGIDDSMWTVGQPVFLPIQNDNPSYRLAYTAWKNGPRKLGMIYCYQRESSIFVTDLTKQLLGTEEKYSEESANGASAKSSIHVLVTPGTKLARSARFSPDGSKMVFLGSRKVFASHNGCSELLSVEVADIIRSLTDSNEKGSVENGEKKAMVITTIVPSVGGACTSGQSQLENSFPGIYTDQLPRNCFLSNDCVVMSSPWGSVESLIVVHLPTKSVQKIDVALEGTAPENANKISSNILDIQRIESADNGAGESRSQLLLTVSTPSSSQVVGVLDVLLVVDTNQDEKNGGALIVTSSLILQPNDYSVAQMPISRKKPTMKKETAPILSSEVSMTAETVHSNGDKLYGPSASDLIERLADKKDLNSLLTWKTKRYHDTKGIPYESILITPRRTEKGVFGYESLGTSRKCPLIVVPHGGPHSCMTTSYVASYAFLALRLGAAVLHVNYRGSTGFGQDSIDALLGTQTHTHTHSN